MTEQTVKPNELLQISAVGEYLTAAELCLRGWQIFFSPHQPSFDIAAFKGRKAPRVQVKACLQPSFSINKTTGRYAFSPSFRGTNDPYTREECDFLVFVCIEHRAFFILPVEAIDVTKYYWSPGAPDTKLSPYLGAWGLLEK